MFNSKPCDKDNDNDNFISSNGFFWGMEEIYTWTIEQ